MKNCVSMKNCLPRALVCVSLALATMFQLRAETPVVPSYDVVIVGGTPAGIMAAVAAAREGKDCLILERSGYVGGLPANGLGATDIATRGATGGLFMEFVRLNREYYEQTYGKDSPQVRDCAGGYHFEPSVAVRTFDRMLSAGYEGSIKVLVMQQFDSDPANVDMDGDRIVSIRVRDRNSGALMAVSGKMFIDATYEGDLGAAAGVPYRLGREGADEYGEPCAGKLYRWWKHGPDMEGTTYQGDNAVQAYNYRLCLTDRPDNMVPVPKPEGYDRTEYVSLVDDVLSGRHTDVKFASVSAEDIERNRRMVSSGGRTSIPMDPWGIWKVTNMVTLPNGKTDANNQHLALISTDLPEENWPWPTAGWDWRDRFAQRLRDYTLGLLWFAQHDEALPESFRNECLKWGLAADEYKDNGNFPRQVYVREGRRLQGTYFFTAHDAMPSEGSTRPPLHHESVTASHYALDSHAVLKREEGRVHLDGFFSHPTSVYTVPFGVMVPQKVDNLLFPVAVSGSHVGFSTMRMEPCWMALGEAAGEAASIAIDSGKDVRSIDIPTVQDALIDNGAVLVYFSDLKPSDKDYALVQRAALKGLFPDYRARLDEEIDKATAKEWMRLSGRKFRWKQGMTRREALVFLAGN